LFIFFLSFPFLLSPLILSSSSFSLSEAPLKLSCLLSLSHIHTHFYSVFLPLLLFFVSISHFIYFYSFFAFYLSVSLFLSYHVFPFCMFVCMCLNSSYLCML
jgi:hypothetical protein